MDLEITKLQVNLKAAVVMVVERAKLGIGKWKSTSIQVERLCARGTASGTASGCKLVMRWSHV